LPENCSFGSLSSDLKSLAYSCPSSTSVTGQQGWLARIKDGKINDAITIDADILLSFAPDSSGMIVQRGDILQWLAASSPTQPVDIANIQSSGGATWSPDNSAMALCGHGCAQIYILDLGDWKIQKIADENGRHFAQYGWSPDGKAIAYIVGDIIGNTDSMKVNIVSRATSESRTLFESDVRLTGTSWSPNNEWIAIRGEGDGKTSLWLHNPIQGNQVNLEYDFGGADTLDGWNDLMWSPDSSRLALKSDRGIQIIEIPTGTVLQQITGDLMPLRWRADAKALLTINSMLDNLHWVMVP
jgi:Tol biopolymer transport system component